MKALAERGAALIGGTLRDVRRLSGGDLSAVLCVTLADGRQAIVKNGPAPRVEAAMLRALAAAGAPAPDVLGADDQDLVLALLTEDGRLSDAWADLGQCLARLHGVEGRGYGWDADYAFGAVRIDNAPLDDWPAFWAERRLRTHLPHIVPDLGRRIERLAGTLPDRLPQRPRASLLHGDLWGGNILVSGQRVSGLIDPASYYGDGAVDIAMLGLFDRPGDAFFEAYGARPAPEHLAIYRLWPALVHLRLFGNSYRGMVEGLLDQLRS